MDCSPMSDGGASAIVLASESYVKRNRLDGIRIVSSGISQDYLAVHSRKSVYSIESAKLAARDALRRSGRSLKDISFVELHDSYSIYGILLLEELGIRPARKGKGTRGAGHRHLRPPSR